WIQCDFLCRTLCETGVTELPRRNQKDAHLLTFALGFTEQRGWLSSQWSWRTRARGRGDQQRKLPTRPSPCPLEIPTKPPRPTSAGGSPRLLREVQSWSALYGESAAMMQRGILVAMCQELPYSS